jgi:thioredoxin family protein
VYPDPRVTDLVTSSFVPVRAHVKDQQDLFQQLGARFGVQWTPTILVVDPEGQERHRIEGYLPVDDFLPQLLLGRAHSAFGRGDFTEAERLFDQIVRHHPRSEAAPEAQYWTGVSRYKGSGDATALAETARKFDERYSDTTWAKKASVWKH